MQSNFGNADSLAPVLLLDVGALCDRRMIQPQIQRRRKVNAWQPIILPGHGSVGENVLLTGLERKLEGGKQ